ncbi:uncharacterized protein TrAtP1_009348 [Trichoderma atroviride]|uniref:uncharacterized protein n=1 Tax=Hypocrea atroviridis TaxID=63577 RepID=UPI00333114B6|nr:hypothetical protein TrAtP1_009348 [Trichoderma atroviride]
MFIIPTSALCLSLPPSLFVIIKTSSPLQPDIYIHAVDPPFPLAQHVAQPLEAHARPLVPQHGNLLGGGAGGGRCGGIEHVDDGFVEGAAAAGGFVVLEERRGGGRPGLEPVAAEVEEAAVGPVARGEEEDEQEDGAVDAGAVEEVGADEEEEDEGGRGVCWDEEEREPTVGLRLLVMYKERENKGMDWR